MSKNIIIVESPAKAKTIEKYLGRDFTVLASYGHVRDLPSKDGSVDPADNFAMHYQTSPDSEKNLKAIANAVKMADAVYLATDPDREGEAISWHVLEELKQRLKKNLDGKPIHRIVFTEITKTAVQYAVANPRGLDMALIDAQQARRALDYLVGFNLSPVLWRKVKGGLSAGRVQSVALRLICDRENEIEAFKAEEYWTMDGLFATPKNQTFSAKLAVYNGKKVEKFTFREEGGARAAEKLLASLTYTLNAVEKKQVRRYPSPPFMTSTLQQEASRKLGFTARRTMQTAQRLYEAGHISYMRTDSVNLAAEAITALRREISTRYGEDFVPEKPNYYKSKQQNAQEAHEAIRPTAPHLNAGALGLEDDQRKLYELIWKRTLACQMTPAVFDQTTLNIEDPTAKNAFRATGRIMIFAGFIQAYTEGRDDDTDDDGEALLPPVTQGDAMDLQKLKPEQHFTEPPPRFTEATLVKTLEEYGIGRPSTFATIISTIQDRGYVRLEQKRFFPEDVGRVVSKFLCQHFEKYVDYNFTAHLEDDLDAVSRGEKKWQPLLKDFWTP
ncbi:MAG: type I DNA topoisomerase, partial [Alphaproteobacteria bacterium]